MTSDWNLWAAQCLLEELIRNGIRQFIIAPGSRSAPLTLAAGKHPLAVVRTHFDERGAGFLALGLAKGGNQPVAVITTSGSAVANLLPAVVEGRQSNLGLVLLTADRPPELINCGANQAIRQPGIFSHYPVAELFLEPPDSSFAPREWLLAIDQCLAQVGYGPVHINCPFREPLYPGAAPAEATTKNLAEAAKENPSKTAHSAVNGPSQWPELAACPGIPDAWLGNKLPLASPNLNDQLVLDDFCVDSAPCWKGQGVIVAGQLNFAEGRAVARLAAQLRWPVLADLHSHCRNVRAPHVFARFGLWLTDHSACDTLRNADILLQFGGRLTDKKLQQWVQQQAPQEHWVVARGEYCPDPDHRATRWINEDICCVVGGMLKSAMIDPEPDTLADLWCADLLIHESRCENIISERFATMEAMTEAAVCRQLSRLLPRRSQCFTGNSLPVRLMDLFAVSADVNWFSQRGASGIDGVLAHAFGVSLSAAVPTTLLLGDLSLLHDLNSLALPVLATQAGTDENLLANGGTANLQAESAPFVIIVLNNNGGNIFQFLPIPDALRRPFFQTPHGFTFKDVCSGFGLRYRCPKVMSKFSEAYSAAIQQCGATLIEVVTSENGACEEIADIRRELDQCK